MNPKGVSCVLEGAAHARPMVQDAGAIYEKRARTQETCPTGTEEALMSADLRLPLASCLPSSARAYPILPPVTITRQALFQFNLSIHRQLGELEKQFAWSPQAKGLFARGEWLPPLRKPR